MEDENTQSLKTMLRAASLDGRISCLAARVLAERLDVPYVLVGRAADELGIKICDCQLGCF